MSERESRLGVNEALFREVNERLKDVNESFGFVLDEAEFVCECGNRSCTQRIAMTLEEYEELRQEPTHFAVVPGHEDRSAERVIDRRDAYVVVEKREGVRARIAEETDPRS